MQDIGYLDAMVAATRKMSHGGVFLSVPGDNVMTIGWGSIGYFWGKPVFVVPVRPSRYTYGLIERADCFTVSVPLTDQLKKPLALAGSLSGRDGDKFARCGLTRKEGLYVDCPVVQECQLHFECVVRLRQDMTSDRMDAQVLKGAYPSGDLHRMFFGEILGCYRTDL